MAVVNPFSNPCAPTINLGGQVCFLQAPPSPIKIPRFGPFWVDYDCLYTCQNPARAHVIHERRILFFFQWSFTKDDD